MEYLILAIFVVIGIVMLLYMAKSAFRNNLTEQELYFDDFPKTFGTLKLFFISDIHRREIADELLQKVKGRVDLVIIGGDLRENKIPIDRVKGNILKLKELGPVYFVWGNNDYEGDYRELDALMLDLGVKVLANTAASFETLEGEKIALLGVDDLTLHKDRLDLALSDAEEGCFRILASHNPGIIKKISAEHGISLVLSGHTHGGQIRILGFGPYKKGGIEKFGETVLLTSNGYGTTSIPLRLGAPAEGHLIFLSQGSQEFKR